MLRKWYLFQPETLPSPGHLLKLQVIGPHLTNQKKKKQKLWKWGLAISVSATLPGNSAVAEVWKWLCWNRKALGKIWELFKPQDNSNWENRKKMIIILRSKAQQNKESKICTIIYKEEEINPQTWKASFFSWKQNFVHIYIILGCKSLIKWKQEWNYLAGRCLEG